MKEVIKYLKNLRENIETINKLKREHMLMIEAIERNGGIYTKERLKQFKNTNDKVSDIIVVEQYFNAL